MEDEYIKLKTYVDIETIDDWYYAAAGPAVAILKELLPTVTFMRCFDEVTCSVGHVHMTYDTYRMKALIEWRAAIHEWQAHQERQRDIIRTSSKVNGFVEGKARG